MNTRKPGQSPRSTIQPFYLPKRTLQERNRLTFQHHALRMAMSGNFVAPVPHPKAILDVVCGTGVWTADMGKLFPEAEIVGLDITKPICPQSPHFQFIEGRTPVALPFNDARFEYVHQRCLSSIIPTGCWQPIVNELFRVTQPGGWIELMEYGLYVSAGPATEQFCQWWQNVLALRGIDLKVTQYLKELLQNAGVTHAEQKTISIPLYGEGRATGVMRANCLSMIQMARDSIWALGVSQSAWVSVTSSLSEEWLKHKTAYQFYAACGQRANTLSHASLEQRAHAKKLLPLT